jgi:hypothetical protein
MTFWTVPHMRDPNPTQGIMLGRATLLHQQQMSMRNKRRLVKVKKHNGELHQNPLQRIATQHHHRLAAVAVAVCVCTHDL